MRNSILSAVRTARAAYEHALLKSDDKARSGHAAGALTIGDLREIRSEAWGQLPDTPLAFWDADAADQGVKLLDAPTETTPASVTMVPAPEAKAVAEGEDVT